MVAMAEWSSPVGSARRPCRVLHCSSFLLFCVPRSDFKWKFLLQFLLHFNSTRLNSNSDFMSAHVLRLLFVVAAERPYARTDSAPPPYVRSNSEFPYPQIAAAAGSATGGGPSAPAYGRSNSDYMNPQPPLYPSSPGLYPGTQFSSSSNLTLSTFKSE